MERIIIKIADKYYPSKKAQHELLRYIAGKGSNAEKETVTYIGADGVSNNYDDAAMQFVKIQNHAAGNGGARRAYHMTVSFPKNISNPAIAEQAARNISEEIFFRHQVFCGVHTSTDNLHIHFAINAVSYVDGKKWHVSNTEFQNHKKQMLETVNQTLTSNGCEPLSL